MLVTPTKRTVYLQRRAALEAERSSFISHWQDLSRYFLPRSGRFIQTDRNKGDKRFNNIYDNTGTRCVRVLAAGLMSGMTSPARPWFRLATRDKMLMEYAPVKNWLDDVTSLMRDVFNQSNTYRSLHSLYEEISVFGTGASFLLEDFNDVIRHYPLTIGEYALAVDQRGEANAVVRSFDMTVAQIVERCTEPPPGQKSASRDWSRVSTSVKNLWDTNKLDVWVPVMHIVEPRADRDIYKRDARNMRYASCLLELGGNEDKLLSESGFNRFPCLAVRWDAKGGDIYGTSCPGMEGLGDVKQLQHGQLRKSQGIDYMVKPPVQVPAGTKSHEVDMLPGGMTITNMTAGNSAKTLFDTRLDLQFQLEDIRDVRDRIRETFFADLFLMLAMDEKNQPDTARAVAEKHEEKLLMLGPVLERLHNELLKPKVNLVFDRMIEADILPPPPQEMQGQELNIEFVSMLAQAQRAIGTQAIDRYVGSLGMVAQFKPDVLDKFDSDRWADKYGDMLGIDPDLIVANDKVAIIRDKRAQVQAAQAQMAAAEQMANTAKAASQANTAQPSVLTDVMSGLTGYSGPGLPVAA